MKAPAYLNHSRWVVECPRKRCRSASKVRPDTSRIRCACTDDVVCEHKDPCNQPIEPQFPDDVARIVAVLGLRPNPANRNWYPGETVDMLKAENIEHGIEVP